jgi:hypothetical protein
MSTNVTGTEWVPIPDEDLVRFRQFGCWQYGAVIERHPDYKTVLTVNTTGGVEQRREQDIEPYPHPNHPLHGKYVRRAARIL